MKKKTLAVLLTLAMTASIFAGCGSTSSGSSTSSTSGTSAEGSEAAETTDDGASSEDTYKSVRYGMGYDADTLDIGSTNMDSSVTPAMLLVEPLLRMQDGEPGPGVAESWDVSDDSMEWTFHLRESTFSDGTPITAETFVYSLTRQANPENGLSNMSSVSDICGVASWQNGETDGSDLGIEAVDDYTLKLTFDYPQYEKTFTTYTYAPVSQELVESAAEAYGSEAEYFLGNGPFMLSDWTHDAEIVMVKNPTYWNAEAIKLDEITQVAGATGDTAVDMMSTGDLDACSFTTKMYLDSAMEIDGMTQTVAYTGAQSCHINCTGKTEETGKWLSNVNFRKALSYAIDREALVAAVYTTDTAAASVIPDSEEGVNGKFNDEYDTGSFNTTADAEKAQEYLAAAMEELGVSDASEIPTFTMLAFDSEGNVTCLNAIADMWNKTLGINCELDMEPIQEMLSKAMSRDFDFWKGGTSNTIDAVDFFTLYDSQDGQIVNYVDDEQFHELYQAARMAASWQERKDAEAELATYFTENMMDIVITWQGSYTAYNSKITNVQEGSMFIDLTYSDIE